MASVLRFAKVEAVGNNFVLIEALDGRAVDWPSLSIRMCERRRGVGSDGLLALVPSTVADFRMRMFNTDGTEDVCGNGLRCVAEYVRSTGLSSSPTMSFEVMSGVRKAEILPDGVRVDMGRPSLRPIDIPAALEVGEIVDYPLRVGGEEFLVTCVSVGTPHAVILASPESFWERIPEVSPLIEVHPVFPERISVTWCARIGPEDLLIRTWERGVGPTLGCGTGACAALVAASLHGLVGARANVRSPGGVIRADWVDRANVRIAGPAAIRFRGEWPLEGDEGIS